MTMVQLSIRQLKRYTQSRVQLLLLSFLLLLSVSTQALADEITLNLKDADIRALISTVSKFTGKNFIIDPRVKAKVTVISANPLTPEAVYEVFLSVLQVHGYAAVPTGSVIKIVPEVNAKQGPLPMYGKDDVFPGDELVTKIIRLNHVPASQLVPILRPLVPQQGHLAAYNPTNTLIITDHSANIQRLMKIIASVDRPDSDELEVIPLKHASASELVRILNSLNTTTAKDAASPVKLAADDRTNSILVTGDRSSRLRIRTTISYLDTPLEDGSGNTHVVYLKYAKAENLVKILSGLKDQGAATGASKIKTAPVKVTSGSVISQNAIIQADDETNALIITADPNTVKNLKAVIRQLDIRRAQVLIEAIIAEITTNNQKEVGVGLAVDGTQKSSGALPALLSNYAGIGDLLLSAANTEGGITQIPSALTFGLGGETSSGVRYGALLRALQTDTNTNILSTPNIVTLDNEEAELIVGQNLPFVTGSFTGTGSQNPNNPFQTIERQDVGLTLKVTPQINEGDTVKLVLEQETSSVIPGTFEQGTATRKRSIKTSVLVDDGGLLILGGLISEEVSDTESKVPLLGDIPVIGFLFRTENTTRQKANLMVFLRPTILRDSKDATFVTNEKYSRLRGVESGAYNEEDDSFGLLDNSAPRLPPIEEIDRSKETVEKSQVTLDPAEDESEDWSSDEYL
jgi:general secretion pathway protein D